MWEARWQRRPPEVDRIDIPRVSGFPDRLSWPFAVRRLIAQLSAPAAFVIGGFAADPVFGTRHAGRGRLAPLFGGILGVGPGAGISLMFVLACMGGILIGLAGYASHHIRNAEDILPDHEAGLRMNPDRGRKVRAEGGDS